MKFSTFIKYITTLKAMPLGGLEAQFKLAPAIRLHYNAQKIAAKKPKVAAILALFYQKEGETYFLLNVRASYNGTHSAQISFPGGKQDVDDQNLQTTALRETFEEIGIPSEEITIIKQLTQAYIPPSNFLVTPFLGYTEEEPTFKTNHEVAALIEVPLAQLLNSKSISKTNVKTSYAGSINVPCFKLKNHVVWGATAMMLSEIKELFMKL